MTLTQTLIAQVLAERPAPSRDLQIILDRMAAADAVRRAEPVQLDFDFEDECDHSLVDYMTARCIDCDIEMDYDGDGVDHSWSVAQ